MSKLGKMRLTNKYITSTQPLTFPEINKLLQNLGSQLLVKSGNYQSECVRWRLKKDKSISDFKWAVSELRALNLQSNELSSEGFDKYLHASPQTENQVESRFLLDVVVLQGSTILKPLTSEDEPLLV